ncbi:hypothetical protein KEM54_003839 [Ascosphaera aggregata]|nr:hypothetical protein KEM54_003839 [Ascosphaera aggregata]
MAGAYSREEQNNALLDSLSSKTSALKSITLNIYDQARDQETIHNTSEVFSSMSTGMKASASRLTRMAKQGDRVAIFKLAGIIFVIGVWDKNARDFKSWQKRSTTLHINHDIIGKELRINPRRSNNAAAERAAAQNQAAVKNLLKLEANKVCADCKRNKHPRWASWNIGVFICIRCSGHHRGMGTHISRVKSVDLDSWTDEQMKSMVKWGNARANKYWEAKLAPGHVPSEAKIENFIRTKYEARRWVIPGPMPDPSTLDDHEEDKPDENIPLAIIQEKIKAQHAAGASAGPKNAVAEAVVAQSPALTNIPARQMNLVDDDDFSATLSSASPSGSSTAQPQAQPLQQLHSQVTSSASSPTARARPSDSIFGFDLFGSQASSGPFAPGATASTTALAGGMRSASGGPAEAGGSVQSRPDLKQSILSLYATPQQLQPKTSSPQGATSPVYAAQSQSIFDTLTSPNAQAPQQQQQKKSKDAFSGLVDSFSGLSFPSSTSPQPAIVQTQQQHRRYQSPPSSSLGSPSSSTAHRPSPSLPNLSKPNLKTTTSALPKAGTAQPVGTLSGTSNPLTGGNFFDSPAPKVQLQRVQPQPQPPSSMSDSVFDDFAGFQSAPAAATVPASDPSKPATPSSSAIGQLGELSSSANSPTAKTLHPSASASTGSSLRNAFDLSSQPASSNVVPNSPPPSSKPKAISSFFLRHPITATTTSIPAQPSNTLASPSSSASSAAAAAVSAFPDPWVSATSSTNTGLPAANLYAWSTSDPISLTPSNPLSTPAPSLETMRMPESLTANDIGSGWGAPTGPKKPVARASSGGLSSALPAVPVVAADEDIGGWISAGVAGEDIRNGHGSNGGNGAALGNNDDLFDNVWQ